MGIEIRIGVDGMGWVLVRECGEPAVEVGGGAEVGAAVAADEGFVEEVGGVGVAVFEPASGGVEHGRRLRVVIGEVTSGFPGEEGGGVAVMEADFGNGAVPEGAGEFAGGGGEKGIEGGPAGFEVGADFELPVPDGIVGG